MTETATQPTILINPPPQDRCCEGCKKHLNELKPFGGAGDPLVGDFSGQKLVKTFRGTIGRMQKYEDILNEIGTDAQHLDAATKKYGPEEIDNAFTYDQIYNTVGASWNCRDCIVLDDDEFYAQREPKTNPN